MAADTEEVIPEALRSRGEKIHVVSDAMSEWRLVIAGAGDVDYIGMARDFIREKVTASPGNASDISIAIRESIHEIWRDFACYEPVGTNFGLLIGSWSNDHALQLTVVDNAAVREGKDLEVMGTGDATFRSIADRYLQHGMLSHVCADIEAVRIFTVYAMLQAKRTIPGVGGNTRIVTLGADGSIKNEKSWKVVEIQDFFDKLDGHIRLLISGLLTKSGVDLKDSLSVSQLALAVDLAKLRKKLQEIEDDPMLS